MTGERAQRRLAAVLAADVAGYSRLMGADEEGTLARLKAVRKALVDPTIAAHHGRIVKTTGDGMLVEFASAVDAARCSVEVQRGMAGQNADVPHDVRIEFRIGIHVGDIIIDDNDIFGDGVNVAARLEGIAEPGGVCVSDDAQRQIRSKVDITFEDMGPQNLKNIVEPLRAWRVRLDGQNVAKAQAGTPTGQASALALPDKPSIAVLPFQNMSGDAEQEYFVDGLVEDIITALSRVTWFFVIARNSSFTYKGRAVDVRQVGRELGVRYILEGSVRKAGNRLRITGQLIDAAIGNHIWADRFEGALDDIFELQDKITASVAGVIQPKLQQAEIQRAQGKPTENLTAYDCYLRALALFHDFTKDSFPEALVLLDRAVASDRRYSSAYALAALCRASRVTQGWTAGDDDRAQALRMAKLAVELGKDDPSALAMAGRVLAGMGGNYEEGLAYIERALALNPNAALAWQFGGWVCWQLGRHEKCIKYNEKAMLLSPLDPLAYRSYTGIAWAYFFTGRFDEAIVWADKAIGEQPNFLPSLRIKVAAAAMANRADEMRDALLRLRAAQQDVSIATLMEIHTSRSQSQRDFYEVALRKAGLT